MEKRLREYELRGVEASRTLQSAARKVLDENSKLRSLLRTKGVMDVEVDEYLGSSGQDLAEESCDMGGLSARRSSRMARSSVYAPEHSTAMVLPLTAQQSRPKSTLVNNTHSGSLPYTGNMAKDHKSAHHTASPAANEAQKFDVERHQISAPCPPLQAHVVHSETADQRQDGKQTTDNTTSCMEAAMIIASMNNGLTKEEINAELGCAAELDCIVDNHTLFRVMDR
ncbi:MAG: hypothetical protein M1837_005289 [Sclerophora amabilis]|nr:MAG: hypothetical protein M1837_005289 [Sclerophora amabilis]